MSDLKSALSEKYLGYKVSDLVEDCNLIMTTGLYRLNTDALNAPKDMRYNGTLVCLNTSNFSRLTQIAIEMGSGKIWMRSSINAFSVDKYYGEWVPVSDTIMSASYDSTIKSNLTDYGKIDLKYNGYYINLNLKVGEICDFTTKQFYHNSNDNNQWGCLVLKGIPKGEAYFIHTYGTTGSARCVGWLRADGTVISDTKQSANSVSGVFIAPEDDCILVLNFVKKTNFDSYVLRLSPSLFTLVPLVQDLVITPYTRQHGRIRSYAEHDPDWLYGYGYKTTTSEIVVSAENQLSGYFLMFPGETITIYKSWSTTKVVRFTLDKTWLATITAPSLNTDDDGNYIYTAEFYQYVRVQLSTNSSGASSRTVLLGDRFEYAFYEDDGTESNSNIVDLWVFAGQSNMAGRGVTNSTWTETAPTILPGAGFEFRAITDPTKLYIMAEPFGKNENNPDGINDGTMKTGSMVTAFTNAYYGVTKVPVVGVSASKGGSNMTQWLPDSTQKYLPDAIQRFKDAVSYLTTNGYKIRHKYILWCQGESDGDVSRSESDYKSMFSTMLENFLAAGIEKLFFVRIGNCNSNEAFYGRYTNIIKYQTEICKTNPNVIMASTDLAGMRERGLMKDSFHYYQAGYNEVGKYAGVNCGIYVTTGKEPTMYDPEYKNLYYCEKN